MLSTENSFHFLKKTAKRSHPGEVFSENVQNLFVYLQITKRRKLGGISIPAVQTATMRESNISIEQLSSFKDLLENIENIEVSIGRC